MRLATATLVVLALSGCSLFGDEAEDLRFETLVQSDTFLPLFGDPPGALSVLQSEAEEQDLRARTSAPPFPRAIDYRREAVVVYAVPSARAGGRVTITRIVHQGDEVRITAVSDGVVPSPDASEAIAVAAHFVVVPDIGEHVSYVLADYRLER